VLLVAAPSDLFPKNSCETARMWGTFFGRDIPRSTDWVAVRASHVLCHAAHPELVGEDQPRRIANAAEAFDDETRRRASGRQGFPAATASASGCLEKMLAACCSRRFCVLELRSTQSWCQRASLRKRPHFRGKSAVVPQVKGSPGQTVRVSEPDCSQRSFDRGPGISRSRSDAGPITLLDVRRAGE
jgi:hypothetical protein